MSKSTKASTIACAVAMAMFVSGANASPGGVGGATEVTQIMNNVQLGIQTLKQIRSMEELIQSTIMHTKNWKQLLLTNLPLGMGDVMASVGDLNREIGDFQRYQTSLSQAGSSLDQLRQTFDVRTVQASLRGVSFADYLKQEAARIADGDKQAKQRLLTEQSIIERANQDLAIAVSNSANISPAVGPTEAIGMLNSQVNQLVQQNARTAQIMANATGTEQALIKKKEAADAQRSVETGTQMKDIETDRNQRNVDAINALQFK